MTAQSGKALFVDEDDQFVVRDAVGMPDVADNELLIEVRYSGVNPADIKHTALGIRSTTIGYDFCGRVLSVPTGSMFRAGDIVAGYTPSGLGRAAKYGTHQSHVACPVDMAFAVHQDLPESHAAALTVVTMTAADAIFNLFRLPSPTHPVKNRRPILIWGGSSSVGICAVQFARASGCQHIFVTASPSRHELLRRLGATHVFDYSSPTVVADITSAVDRLGQGPIAYAFDAVGNMGTASSPSSASMVAQCATESGAILSSVVLQQDERFRMPVATTKDSWEIHPPGAPGPISILARPEHHWHAWAALLWAVENYGAKFQLPSVQVFEGTAEEALRQILNVANGGRRYGKLVIRQPMK